MCHFQCLKLSFGCLYLPLSLFSVILTTTNQLFTCALPVSTIPVIIQLPNLAWNHIPSIQKKSHNSKPLTSKLLKSSD